MKSKRKRFGKGSLILMLGLLCGLFSMTASAAVPTGAAKWSGNGHYYKVFNRSMIWTDAKSYCESLGGHLVTVTSLKEEKFVEKLVAKKATKRYFWLGGTDEAKEGTWKWVTSEKWDYTNWDNEQPNNSTSHDSVHGQDYLLMQYVPDTDTRAFSWDDQPNDGCSGDSKYYNAPYNQRTAYYGFICEWEQQSILKAVVDLDCASYVYNGKNRTPNVTVKLNGTSLTKGKDYTVTYAANQYPGYGYVKITGKGNYTGSLKKYFKIAPKQMGKVSVKRAGSGEITVKWPVMSHVTGYQLQYKEQGGSWKTMKLASNVNSVTLSKLMKKKYYVRIRAYATGNGKTAYGAYSDARGISVK